MLLKLIKAFLSIVIAATVLPCERASAEDRSPNDYFGIGLDFEKFCDFKSGAAISDTCYAFMGAVIEIVESENLFMPKEPRFVPATCIPHGLKTKEIVEKIQPRLRFLICAGVCTSTSYVITALAAAYPCKG